jgi:hypothetical protein
MTLLTRKQILAISDIVTQTVSVPEWGGEVLVRGLSGAERDQFEATFITVNGASPTIHLQGMRAQLVSMAVVDEKGELLFTPDDVIALGAKSAVALQRVFDVAQKLSGLTKADVEELAKNLPKGQNGGSPSD